MLGAKTVAGTELRLQLIMVVLSGSAGVSVASDQDRERRGSERKGLTLLLCCATWRAWVRAPQFRHRGALVLLLGRYPTTHNTQCQLRVIAQEGLSKPSLPDQGRIGPA